MAGKMIWKKKGAPGGGGRGGQADAAGRLSLRQPAPRGPGAPASHVPWDWRPRKAGGCVRHTRLTLTPRHRLVTGLGSLERSGGLRLLWRRVAVTKSRWVSCGATSPANTADHLPRARALTTGQNGWPRANPQRPASPSLSRDIEPRLPTSAAPGTAQAPHACPPRSGEPAPVGSADALRA